jgi:regulator of nucleoside diphosphate kinase
VLTQNEQTVVTTCDRRRLRQMIDALCASLPASGEPYGSYLRALDARLSGMATVERDEVNNDVVTMNSKVTVRELDSERRQELTLVYATDADPFGEKVSVLTPLGAELLGSRIGDVIEWQTRRGPRRVRIEEIVFQPEAAGKFEL